MLWERIFFYCIRTFFNLGWCGTSFSFSSYCNSQFLKLWKNSLFQLKLNYRKLKWCEDCLTPIKGDDSLSPVRNSKFPFMVSKWVEIVFLLKLKFMFNLLPMHYYFFLQNEKKKNVQNLVILTHLKCLAIRCRYVHFILVWWYERRIESLYCGFFKIFFLYFRTNTNTCKGSYTHYLSLLFFCILN